ncbi:NF-kappa-B inhibitor alpha-like [Scleropages formosus]|uniref:NF-kappa-B inhibitor alpha n=2 Tax=Scleropages formosus TaxID=113540 RepID=A0A0P7XJQ6_SCLFO|nr:NF-kappa-B inhibitor alpha-like [Scleropages formosus]
MDDQDSKLGKGQPCADERLDSGLDSLREDECSSLAADTERLSIGSTKLYRNEMRSEMGDEPWKRDRSDDGDTFLHLAIIHEAADYAVKMIKQSVNDPFLNIQNYQRQSALHLAVITEQPQIVDHLLKAGCDPQLVDNQGNTALHIACKRGSLSCFSVLTQSCPVELPTLMSAKNYSGLNCIHLACIHGFFSLVESLIQLGADINAREHCNGRSALHLAVDLQNQELVRLLISLGADVNSLTYGGYSPYHLTHGRQNTDIQRQLYELTAHDLRELPESESEDSDDDPMSEDEEMYDDILLVAQQ